MSLDKTQFKTSIINRILKNMGAYSSNASNLIWGTICQESLKGRYIRQKGMTGRYGAFGFIQMEMDTANDIKKNFINYRPKLLELYQKYYNQEMTLNENLVGNIHFQVFMCRCHYLRVPSRIPDTLQGQAQYWKEYYNTNLGKGTVEEYIKNYI